MTEATVGMRADKLAAAAAYQLLTATGKLHCWQKVAVALALLAIPAAVLARWNIPMSQRSCQLVQHSFPSSAVLAGLQEEEAAAQAASSSQQKLHILTIVGSNTPRERIEGSPLLQGLPPSLRRSVRMLWASTRIGHGIEGFGAFGAKIIELFKYVNDTSVPATDLVLLTDAFDVVMDARAIASIPDKFAAITNSSSSRSSGGSSLAVLFAAEQACWPDIPRCSCYPQLQHTPYRYLNAGGLVGHAGYLRALLRPLMHQISGWTDDQRFYTGAYLSLREQHGFHLDSNCQIFQTLAKVKMNGQDLVFDAGKSSWYNTATRSYPVLVHGNGNTKKMFFQKVMPRVAEGWNWLHSSHRGDNHTCAVAAGGSAECNVLPSLKVPAAR